MIRSDIRKAFKAIGYTVSFPRNKFNHALCNIAFKNGDCLHPIVVASGNCYSPETYAAHRQAFDLALTFKGEWLEDTEQKIV